MLTPTPSILTAVCGSILILLAGCSRTTPIEEARAQNKLLFNPGPAPATLDPHRNTGNAAFYIISALWEPLVVWNEDASGVLPAAAASWEVSEDGRTYSFHLRPDAKWSNGEPVTAHDWVRSFQRWVTPSIAGELANNADPIKGVPAFRTGQTTNLSSLGFHAVDNLTLVLELTEPEAGFITRLTTFPWVPVHFASVEAAGGFYNAMADFIVPGKLISNGAYQLATRRYGQFIEVIRNPHYHSATRLDAIRFIVIENTDTQERAFRSGQLHITNEVPSSKIEVYREAGDPVLVSYPRVGTRYLKLNTTRPPFDDVRVRQAFSKSIDRQKLVEVVLRTGGSPAYALVDHHPGGHQPTALIEESVQDSRRLLAEAGYPNGKGFPAVEYLYNTLDRNRQVAAALQQMWKRGLGVDVTPRNEEWKVFLDTRHRLDYQIARTGWLPSAAEPIELYELCTAGSPTNETGWSHPEFERLFTTARREVDPTKRYRHYAAMDEILLEEMPIIPLGHYAANRLVHPSVTGWPANMVEGIVWSRVGFQD